ncbi:hypothetical protein EUGRSUZ_F00127 [Eucalyptus grandis]|uniref:Uncharacterized protein n=2 Tax=Eucalyptus grandis TaxID=71139 RepID=A0ACC3KB58_EUCGR|nr:hypothetical protein EUGRSUZ_F00127 [Eucalyptus grandis]
MVLTNFNGVGVGFGFGVGCGFGVGWGFGGLLLKLIFDAIQFFDCAIDHVGYTQEMHAVKLPGPWCRWRLWSRIRPWMGIWHCLWKSVSVIHINIPRHRILRQGSSCQKGVQRFNQIVVRVHALEYLPFLRISHALQNPIVCALYPSTGHYFV